MDGIGDWYEYIRKGGSWDRISGNMDKLIDIRDRLDKQCWQIQAFMMLMKTLVGGIFGFTQWCLDRGIMPIYQELGFTRQTLDEDLIHNRALLRELPDWEDNLVNVESMLVNGGIPVRFECWQPFGKS